MPAVLLAMPVGLRVAAAVYGHLLVAARGSDRVAALDRAGGRTGAAPAAPSLRQARAASALAELEAAIGHGTVCLGGARGAPPVVVSERWLVRAVAVELMDLSAVIRSLGLAYSGRRSDALRWALTGALERMSACRAVALFD